jgi:hypothetical protein
MKMALGWQFPYQNSILSTSVGSIRFDPLGRWAVSSAAHLIHHQDHSPSALRHLLDHGAQALLPSAQAQRGDHGILAMKKMIKLLGFNY